MIKRGQVGLKFLWPHTGNKDEFMQTNQDRQYYNYPKPEYINDNSLIQFFRDDYASRVRSRHPEIKEQEVNNIIATTPIYKTATFGAGEYAPPYGYIKINPRYNTEQTKAHELSHALDFRLNLNKYKSEEDLYDLPESNTQDNIQLRQTYPGIKNDSERRATNTEARYKIYKQSGGLTGKQLDSYIKGLSPDSLKSIFDQLNSEYINGSDIKDINATKKTLIEVAHNPISSNLIFAKLGVKLKKTHT